jgi:AcrR family transcriptional regulator
MDEISSKGERTREGILHAAHQLFLQNGFHGTSMRQIAQEAGIAVGGIYNHFASKDDIFVAVLVAHHPIHDILPALSTAQGENVEDFLRDAARRMVESFGNRPEFLNLMFIELVEFNAQHIPGLFQEIFPQVLVFAQRFLRGINELRPIPLSILVRAFVGLFFSYVITKIMLGNQLAAEQGQENDFDYFVDIFLHGILLDNKEV